LPCPVATSGCHVRLPRPALQKFLRILDSRNMFECMMIPVATMAATTRLTGCQELRGLMV